MNAYKFQREFCSKCTKKCGHDILDVKSCDDYISNQIEVYVKDDKTIVAVGKYHGKTVRATAKCNPADTFNYEIGRKIAVDRCNLKIAQRRADDTRTRALNRKIEIIFAQARYEESRKHADECKILLERAEQVLYDDYNGIV